MIVREACDFDFAYVCQRLRDENAAELVALRGHDNRVRMAREFNALKSLALFRLAFCDDERETIALLATYRALTGGAVHLLATPAWPRIARPVYRYMRRAVVPSFPLFGLTLCMTDVLDRGFADRKWLRALGFADEGPPRPLGRGGEMFQRVAWRAIDKPAAGLACGIKPRELQHEHR